MGTRTTVRLDESLYEEVKRLAAEERATPAAVVDRALRDLLARRSKPLERRRVKLPTFKGRGLQPGVDLNNSAALLDLMEQTNDRG